jgi:Fe-S cluster assembly ATP-binding protein
MGLEIKNLSVQRGGKQVLTDFGLNIAAGEVVALTGPNGVGKSSLVLTIMGHPACQVMTGEIVLDGSSLLTMSTSERARLGLFLAHQEPPAIAGVKVIDALQTMTLALEPELATADFFSRLRSAQQILNIDDVFIEREFNQNFSGGEKKRVELLSLLLFNPRYALLDELDAGLDPATKALALTTIQKLCQQGTGFLIITHNLDWLKGLDSIREVKLA